MSDIKTKLVQAYLEIASQEGAASVTLQKAAKLAKIPFATAHYHFGNDPLALTLATLGAVGENAQNYIANFISSPPKAFSKIKNPLELYTKGTFEWAKEHEKEASFWIYHYHLLTFHPELKKKQSVFIETANARIQKLIYESIGMGFYSKVKVDRELSAKIHFSLTGGVIIALTLPQKNAIHEYNELTWSAIEKLLGK